MTTNELLNQIMSELQRTTGTKSLKQAAWVVVGMLERLEAEGREDQTVSELSILLQDKISTDTSIENAILNDLYDIFYWREASTIMQAVRCLRDDYKRSYDENSVKALAREMLYGKGTSLLSSIGI